MDKLWEKIKKTVTEGVSIAAEKTEEYSRIGKNKLEILNIKRKISKTFAELGSITFESIKAGNSEEIMKSSEVEALIDEVKKLEAELEISEQQMEEIKNKPE